MEIKLMEDSFGEEEIKAINECLASKEYTQGKLVNEFEEKFSRWNGSKYGIMVNSGSSANLLMIALLKHKFNLEENDEILVPSVTWPTTVYPIIQNNLKPVFCDVDEGFNINIESIKKMKSEKTRAIFMVHLLGQPANIEEIKKFCEEEKIILIEDCCESMGSKVGSIKVGNFGLMGSFSFYFGHHMTTIEGGMIVTNDHEVYDLLKSMRSHGWIRGSVRGKEYEEHAHKDYIFDVLGYNFRSTNLNAAIGLVQLKKLDDFIKIRVENHKYFIDKISKLNLEFQKVSLDETSSFSLALIAKDNLTRNKLIIELKNRGIESRPIVAGNLLKQPVFNSSNFRSDKMEMADKINDLGLYLPNNQFIDMEKIDYMIDSIDSILNNQG